MALRAWQDEPMHLTAEDVEKLLDLDELIAEMKDALIALSAGKVIQPVRMVLATSEPPGRFALMPAIHGDVMGAKLVTVFPQNAGSNLPTHQAMILLFSARTGEPLATMDGRVITAWRTAAVSALATQASAPKGARVLTILGSGVQAHTHNTALRTLHPFEEVRVWSRTPEHAARFAQEHGARAMELEEAVRGADVICTLTDAHEAFLRGDWLEEYVHINAVGAIGPDRRELDNDAIWGAAVVVECREAARNESKEILASGSVIYAELGELLAGTKAKPANRKTVYKSLGVAIEDVSAAAMVWRKKEKRDIPHGRQPCP
jgi:thiomorpholine-carboxylate dehydrogenase